MLRSRRGVRAGVEAGGGVLRRSTKHEAGGNRQEAGGKQAAKAAVKASKQAVQLGRKEK